MLSTNQWRPKHSLGQGLSLQRSNWTPSPSQGRPPRWGGGLSHRRCRLLCPAPQVTLHGDHACQLPHWPSSGTRVWFYTIQRGSIFDEPLHPPTHPPPLIHTHTFSPRTIKGWVLFSLSMLLSCSYITVFDPKVNWDLKSSSAVEIMRIWHVLLTSGQNLWLSQAAMSLFVWHTFRTGRSSGAWLSKTGRLKQLI